MNTLNRDCLKFARISPFLSYNKYNSRVMEAFSNPTCLFSFVPRRTWIWIEKRERWKGGLCGFRVVMVDEWKMSKWRISVKNIWQISQNMRTGNGQQAPQTPCSPQRLSVAWLGKSNWCWGDDSGGQRERKERVSLNCPKDATTDSRTSLVDLNGPTTPPFQPLSNWYVKFLL